MPTNDPLLVYIHLSGGSNRGIRRAFEKHLPTDTVQWSSRGKRIVAPAEIDSGVRVLGGPVRWSALQAIGRPTVFATYFAEPADRLIADFENAAEDDKDPLHVLANTATLGELIAENEPLVMKRAHRATRLLGTPQDAEPESEKTSASDIIRQLRNGNWIIGFDNPRAFARALNAHLGLDEDSMRGRLFRARALETDPLSRQKARKVTAEDSALRKRLMNLTAKPILKLPK